MSVVVDGKAKAIAEQLGFRGDTIWEMAWVEVIREDLHHVLMNRGILKALWYISEHLHIGAYIQKRFLLYVLQQDLTLGNQQSRGATDKTLREILKQIVDEEETKTVDEDERRNNTRFGWLVESPARNLMKQSGFSDGEIKRSGILGTNKYISYSNDRARTNLSAIRHTVVSVHRTVTAKPFTRWLVKELSSCSLEQFHVHSTQVLNSYELPLGYRHRVAMLIRAGLEEYGYEPNPDQNMQELKPASDQPRNPRINYTPNVRPEPIYFNAPGSDNTNCELCRKAG